MRIKRYVKILIDSTLPAATALTTAKSGYLYDDDVTSSAYNIGAIRSAAGAGFKDFVIREDGVVYAGTTVTGITIGTATVPTAGTTPAGATPIGVATASAS